MDKDQKIALLEGEIKVLRKHVDALENNWHEIHEQLFETENELLKYIEMFEMQVKLVTSLEIEKMKLKD